MFRLESDQVELVSQFAQNNTAQTGKLGHVAPPVSHRHGDVSVNVQVRGLVDDPHVVLLADEELLPVEQTLTGLVVSWRGGLVEGVADVGLEVRAVQRGSGGGGVLVQDEAESVVS